MANDLKKYLDQAGVSVLWARVAEEVEKVRREVWGYYLESKTERENLQAEVDKIKEKKYWYLK